MSYFKVGKTYSNIEFVPKSEAARRKAAALHDGKHRGLGDTVEAVINFTGLGKLVGKSKCNCAKRKAWLNKLFPYA